jgi:Domain of unknown function (DUF1877)
MGCTLYLQQISQSTLEILKREPDNLELFYEAQYMSVSDSDLVQTGGNPDRTQFIREWKTPSLDLHKYFPELTYLLAGHLPDYSDRQTAIPELQSRKDLMRKDNFMQFTIIESSCWDGKPLVNAIWTGTQFIEEGMEWYQTDKEVKEIINGLLEISKKGFRDRYLNEAKSNNPCYQIDWDDKEMIDYLTDYSTQMVNYYLNAADRNNSMFIYLSC